ncbi:MAG: rhodanese-like domain-containing protein [Mycetocola sp.]
MPPVLSGPTVTTQWLADHLGSDDLVILDATVLVVRAASDTPVFVAGFERYLLDGHVPGAVFANLVDVFNGPGGGFPRPDAAAFGQAAASVGIRESSAVVAYDSEDGMWAARLWWLFRSYGFASIAVLDGGLRAWLAEGRETDTGIVKPGTGSIVAVPLPDGWAHQADVDRVAAAGRPPAPPRRRANHAVAAR